MSIFDDEEKQLERVDDTVILKQFLKTHVAPELDKLSKECSIYQYAFYDNITIKNILFNHYS